MKTSKVLILGSRGMLGGQLMKTFAPGVVGWDREEFNLAKITNYKLQITNLKPSIVINCVAFNDVDGAESNRDTAFEINARSVGDLAGICKELGPTLVHFSTNYVFDGKKGGYKEDDLPKPQSVYAQSKYAGERAVIESGCEFYLVRTSVLFGQKAKSQSAKKSFVDLMLDLSEKSDEVRVIDDEVNSVTYVVDLAEQVKLLLEEGRPFGVYHITNSGQGSWYDIAKEIFKTVKPEFKVEKVSAKQFKRRAAIRPVKSVLLNTKLPELRPWQAALREYLNQGV